MNINNLFNKVNDVINNKKAKNELYNQKLKESTTFSLNNEIIIDENILIEGLWYEYTDMCPYINVDQAK